MHVLGMQDVSLLPKYVKRICRFLLLCDFALDNAGISMLQRTALAFIFTLVVLIRC